MDQQLSGTADAVVDKTARSAATVHVVLVHGTWARGFCRNGPSAPGKPRWFEPGSKFSDQLLSSLREKGLTPVLEKPTFEWSGRNSLLHRAAAAVELANVLSRTAPDPCLVVAHSHAGNIALKALDLLAGRERDSLSRVRVLTLSTPFVGVYLPADGTPNVERLMLMLFALQACMALATLRWLIPSMPIWLPFVLAALPLYWGLRLYQATQDELQAMAQHSLSDCLAKRIFHGNKYFLLGDYPPDLLVVRGVEDEASLAISMAAALGRLTQFLRDVSYRCVHGRGKAVLFMGVTLSVLILVLFSFETASRFLGFEGPMPVEELRLVGLVASLLAVLPTLLLGGIASLARAVTGYAAGRELWRIPNLEVSVATAPDLMVRRRLVPDRGITIATVPRRGRPLPHLRHSIYDDPDVFVPIEWWLPDAFDKEIRAARDIRALECQSPSPPS